ncbi:MAG: zf-HC2 domain-containing protein [Candidatus Zapsychrus exili]|nr:zf-HC2 domain-containing protein [Candidatus Zapsychrus exili]
MKCKDVKNLLVSFLESDLSDKDNVLVSAHLDTCQECQKEKEVLKETWLMLDEYEAPKVSSNFTARVMDRIDQQKEKKFKFDFTLPSINFEFPQFVPAMATISVFIVVYALVSSNLKNDTAQLAKKIQIKPDIQMIAKAELVKEDVVESVASVIEEKEIVGVVEVASVPQEEEIAEVVEQVVEQAEVTSIAKVAPQEVELIDEEIDEEIVAYLDVYENMEFYQNYALLEDLDVVEDIDEEIL